MKKLGVTLLAAAFSLPLAFGAKQQTQTAPQTRVTAKKTGHKVSRHKHSGKKRQAKSMNSPTVGK